MHFGTHVKSKCFVRSNFFMEPFPDEGKGFSVAAAFQTPRRRVVCGSGRARRHKTKARLRENILLQVEKLLAKVDLFYYSLVERKNCIKKFRYRARQTNVPSPALALPGPPLPGRNTQSHHQVNKPYKRGSRWKKIYVSVRSGGATGWHYSCSSPLC